MSPEAVAGVPGPRPGAAAASPVIALASDRLTAELRPRCGGKVSRLTDRATGRDWLAPAARPWKGGAGARWQDSDCGGWDECVPNVAAGVHPDGWGPLPDHGELWWRPWTAEAGQRSARTTVSGVRLPYELTRVLTVDGAAVRARYTLTNHGPRPVRAGWAMHMLLDAAPRALRLPPGTPVRVDSVFGRLSAAVRAGQRMTWGALAGRLPDGDGWACKLYTAPGSVGSVSVTDRGTMKITVSDTPRPAVFGLWLNAAGWPAQAPLRHLGVEPGYGDHDDLAAACDAGTALRLGRGAAAGWRVDLDVGESQHAGNRRLTSGATT